MTPLDIAREAYAAADAKQAKQLKLLEITDLTVLSDYFLLCTANSTTHVKTLAGEIELKLKQKGVEPHHIEGHLSNNWVLLDYGCVVVHIFLQETREFYNLDKLWADAKTIELAE